MDKIKMLMSNENYRLIAAIFVGILIGAIFYPTKHIEEKTSLKYEQQIAAIHEEHNKERSSLLERTAELTKQIQQITIESQRKIAKLTSEVKDLKSKQKTSYYKIVRPDGTVEIRKFSETEVTESTKIISQIQDEFNSKISELESKWTSIHKDRVLELEKDFSVKEEKYKKTIADLEKQKVVSVNEKRFGLEIGLQDANKYYGHLSADIAGPLFGGVHIVDGNSDKELGFGIGIRF